MSSFKEFTKYHSLGNDFVVIDWFKRPDTYLQSMINDLSWPATVRAVCQRHTGIGADGLLIIKADQVTRMPEMLVFNADGSRAENCLNGLRCVADYLFQRRQFPPKFTITVGGRTVHISVLQAQRGEHHVEIVSNVGKASLGVDLSILTGQGIFVGTSAAVGNPHFIVPQAIDRSVLESVGGAIMCHSSFPQQTNVEFVWREPGAPCAFRLLVYERGVGITNACSSGAAAVARYLVERKEVARGQVMRLDMLGGSLLAWVDHEDDVYLQAGATAVFDGVLAG